MAQKGQHTETEWQAQREDLLIAIDQLEQMTEVMGEVLCRVKQQMHILENHTPSAKTSSKKSSGQRRSSSKSQASNPPKKPDLVH